jgi:TPR repeat protein
MHFAKELQNTRHSRQPVMRALCDRDMKFHRIGISKRFILSEKYEKAKSLLHPLARKNNSEAQLILGYLYYTGDNKTTAKDSEYWLKKSARNGNAEAIALLASTNFKVGSWSSESENKKSLALTLKAAKFGSAEAQRSLACSYANGNMVLIDNIQTMYWDEKAAKQGLAESQNDLALMLMYGMGGEVNVEKAIYWYQQSANKDHNVPYAQLAAEALARIYSGKMFKELTDTKKSEYWEIRAQYLRGLKYRGHPDWFYN